MKIIDSPVDFIKKNQKRFLRQNNIGVELMTNLVGDIILQTGESVTCMQNDNYWIIGSKVDWIESSSYTANEVFNKIISFPEGGQNSMRSEILLTAFAKNVLLLRHNKVEVMKGLINKERNFFFHLLIEKKWKCLVAFNMPSDEE